MGAMLFVRSMVAELRFCVEPALYVPARSVFQQFVPLLHELIGATMGVPSAHSSCVPECVKPASPDSKSVANTGTSAPSPAHVGAANGSQIVMLQLVSSPPLFVVSSSTFNVHVPPAFSPLSQFSRYSRSGC